MRIAPLIALLVAIGVAIGVAAPALAMEDAVPLPLTLHGAAAPPASPVHEDGAKRCDPRILAGRGCCSHHKGQCGCKNGRVECCDGTLSPSCRCASDSRADER